jgi:hypothetical protein
MKNILQLIDKLDWGMVLILCATLGLAPFSPPHIVEKLSMLRKGLLIKPLDWFDLLLHGLPWVILLIKIIAEIIHKR